MLPFEAQQGQQRLPEGGLAQPDPPFDREGDPERAEHRLERRAPALDRRDDEGDLLRRRARRDELPDLLGGQLERAAGACAFEEADRAVERRAGRRRVGEEMALQMGERGVAVLRCACRKLLDPPACQRGEVLLRAAERCERRAPGLVGQRDGHVRPSRQRLEQPPLRARQVLEAVGEDRTAVPGVQLGPQALDGATPEQVAVPERQAIELLAVRGIEQRQVSVELVRLQQAGLELGERRQQRVREAGEASRAAEPVELRVPPARAARRASAERRS